MESIVDNNVLPISFTSDTDYWGHLIQHFQDPDIHTIHKEHTVISLHQQNEHWLFDHHNDMPMQLIQHVLQYGGRFIFFQTQLYPSILHHAIDNAKPDHIVMNMIEIGGKSVVAAKDTRFQGRTALHLACLRRTSSKVLLKLIECGGKEVVLARDNYGSTALHFILQMDKRNEAVIRKLVEVGGKELIMSKCGKGRNGLFTGVLSGASMEVIEYLCQVGGKHLILEKDNSGSTVIQKLLRQMNKSTNTNFLIRVIKMNGRDIVTQTTTQDQQNVLHHACSVNAPVDLIDVILQYGGRDVVMQQDKYGATPLLLLSAYDKNMPVIQKLLSIGGKDLLMISNINGINPLHKACGKRYSINVNVIKAFLEVGGKDLVLSKNRCFGYYAGWTALHYACTEYSLPSQRMIPALIDTGKISALIDTGEVDILAAVNDNGETALHQMIMSTSSAQETQQCSVIKLLIERGILYRNAGGLDSIGGLFMIDKHVIRHRWEDVIQPLLLDIDRKRNPLLPKLPLLQAIISHGRSDGNTIRDIIQNFENSVSRIDPAGCLPLQVAIQKGIHWDHGLKDIFEAFVAAGHRPTLSIGCEYGLHWNNGMKNVMETNMERLGICDKVTGLYPFMLAAAGENKDLNAIYKSLRLYPEVFMNRH